MVSFLSSNYFYEGSLALAFYFFAHQNLLLSALTLYFLEISIQAGIEPRSKKHMFASSV